MNIQKIGGQKVYVDQRVIFFFFLSIENPILKV